MFKPTVQVHERDGILIAEFWDCWRLDPAPVQDLRSLYEAHLKKGGRPEVVIDLSGVGFAGSAALGSFVSLQRDARRREGRLIFCNVEPTVREVFRASRLESLFEFVNDPGAALDTIAQGPSPLASRPGDGAESAPPAGPPPLSRKSVSPPSPLRRRKRESEPQ